MPSHLNASQSNKNMMSSTIDSKLDEPIFTNEDKNDVQSDPFSKNDRISSVSQSINEQSEQTNRTDSSQQLESVQAQPEQSSSLFGMRNILVVILLLAGVVAVYAPRFFQAPPDPNDTLVYISDLDFWQRTNRETHVRANFSFSLEDELSDIPLELGAWVGQESPETNLEVEILLAPEQYIRRLYQNDQGQYIWLSMIGGRSSRPFHPPDICYDADGWQYNLGSHGAELANGGEVRGLWLEAKKEKEWGLDEHIVFYFYLFPNGDRNLADGIVLFKLTSPRYGSTDETLAMHENFVQTLFTHAE